MARHDDYLDEPQKFLVSADEDDFSQAVTVMAYDIGEAVDEYHRLITAEMAQGKRPHLAPGQPIFVRMKGDEQVYEFQTGTDWFEVTEVSDAELEEAKRRELHLEEGEEVEEDE